MTVSELRRLLSHEFELVAFVDIADVWHKHRSIFDILKSVRQEAFEPHQRIVLYTAAEPSQTFLDHLQRAAARIDISNFFILVVCPYDVEEKLAIANRKFGYDDVTIRSLTYTLENTKSLGAPGFYSVDNLCPLPFLHSSIATNGSVTPCCKFQGSTGRLSEESLSSVFFNEKNQNIRNLMLQGIKPRECSVCWDNESSGTTSFRQLAIMKHGDRLDQGWLDDPQIRNINWSQRSLCNFACRICVPDSSTSIAVENIKFSQDQKEKSDLRSLIRNTNNSDLNKEVIKSLPELKHLETVHILGGEPLLSPDFSSTIDVLIEHGLSRTIDLEFNTNCSVYPEQYIEKIVDNFRSLEILLSVDNVGAKFEIERGGRWTDILENIERFVALKSDRIKVKLAVAVNLQNVLDLGDLVALSEKLGIDIVWWYVEDPDFMCIDHATNKTKELVAERYRGHPVLELQKIASRMLSSPGSDGGRFLDYCRKLDSRRGQSFAETHPTIYHAMGGEQSNSLSIPVATIAKHQ